MCCTSAIGNIAGGKKAGCELRDTGYGLRVAGYGVRDTGYGLRVA
jgi:hypothetical protein